jgi:hypothetical protein
MQLQLFDPAQCQANGEELERLFFSVYLPNQRLRNTAETASVGAVSDALRLCGDDRSHPDFHRFMAGVEKSGDPRTRIESFIDTYRFAQDPKTAHLVAHLNRLDQIEGFRNQYQLNLGGNRGDSLILEAAPPNKVAATINFDDISQGGKLLPHVAGKIGEDSVEGVFSRLGISLTPQYVAPFFGWGKKGQTRPDFLVAPFDADPLRKGFYVEVKWRNRYAGGADDALTALLLNIEAWYDLPVIIIYDGTGTEKDAYETVRLQLERKKRTLQGKLLAVMTFAEFVLWSQTQLGVQTKVAA